LNGTATKPRLSVFCSSRQLYAVLADDHNKEILFYGSTLQKSICGTVVSRRRPSGTTGIWLFAECHILCRVFYFGHSAKSSLPSATQKTLGKIKHSAKKLFAECFIFDTRQRVSLPSVFF
jgi:hypothetical protein